MSMSSVEDNAPRVELPNHVELYLHDDTVLHGALPFRAGVCAWFRRATVQWINAITSAPLRSGWNAPMVAAPASPSGAGMSQDSRRTSWLSRDLGLGRPYMVTGQNSAPSTCPAALSQAPTYPTVLGAMYLTASAFWLDFEQRKRESWNP